MKYITKNYNILRKVVFFHKKSWVVEFILLSYVNVKTSIAKHENVNFNMDINVVSEGKRISSTQPCVDQDIRQNYRSSPYNEWSIKNVLVIVKKWLYSIPKLFQYTTVTQYSISQCLNKSFFDIEPFWIIP